MQTDEQQISQLSQNLRSLFAEFKREQLGTAYRPHPRFRAEELWRKVAENCLFCEADPASFIKAAFVFCTVFGGPFPTQLTSTAAQGWYHRYRDLYGKGNDPYSAEVANQFSEAMRNLVTQTLFNTPVEFFCAPTGFYPMPNYVRFYCLTHLGALPAAERYKKSAARELHGNPNLKRTLEKLGYDTTLLVPS